MFLIFTSMKCDVTKGNYCYGQIQYSTNAVINVAEGEWKFAMRNAEYTKLETHGIRSCCGIAMASKEKIALGHFLLPWQITKEQLDSHEVDFAKFYIDMFSEVGNVESIHITGNNAYLELLNKLYPFIHVDSFQFTEHGNSFTFSLDKLCELYTVQIAQTGFINTNLYVKSLSIDTNGKSQCLNKPAFDLSTSTNPAYPKKTTDNRTPYF